LCGGSIAKRPNSFNHRLMIRRRRTAQRRRRIVIGLLAAAVLYVLFGFFGMPPILKSQFEKNLKTALHRPVTVGRVKFNPFNLAVTVEELQVREPDGREMFVGWHRLYVNFRFLSLLLREKRFDAIELESPRVHVVINADGSLNFSDLLAGTPTPGKPPQPAAPAPPLQVDRLVVTGARMDFQDNFRGRAFASTLGPLTFQATNFHTLRGQQAPYSFEAVTESGEKFAWHGWIEGAPFRSGGELSATDLVLKKYAPYYGEKLGIDLADGKLSVRGQYELDFSSSSPARKLVDGSLTVRNLKLNERGSGELLLDLPAADITGATADGLTLKSSVGRVALQGGRLRLRHEKDGSWNIGKIASPTGSPVPVSVPAPAPAVASQARDFRMGEILLKDWAVELQDLAASDTASLNVSGLNIAAKNFSFAPGAMMPVDLAMNWSTQGKVHLNGQIGFTPLRIDLALDIDSLGLKPLSPYLEKVIDARLTEGNASLKGRATFAMKGSQPPALTFEGESWFERVDLVTGSPGESFAGFSDLVLSGLKVASGAQTSISLTEVNLNAPYARLVLARDGRLNVAGLLHKTPEGSGSAESQPAGGTTTQTPAATVEISRVVINGGNFNFSDNSISPQVRMAVNNLSGVLTGWSSTNPGKGEVNLTAAIDEVGPLTISGKFDPLGQSIFADAKLSLQQVDLLALSPYSGKYAGYELARGKLFVDIQARIADRKLDMTNVITLDGFTFGQPTKSPDATKLPVRLGVALLKDMDGKIVIDAPMQGSLDDPELRIRKVVWRAIENLLVKAATSPFALLGSMFGGGGEELGYQDFPPGSSTLSPEGLPKLAVVMKALKARPGLNLGLEGNYDAAADSYALKQSRAAGEIRQAIWEEKHAKDPNIPPPAGLEIKPEEHAAMVKKLFDHKFPPGTKFGTPLPPPPEVQPPPPPQSAGLVRRMIDFITLRKQREEAEYKKTQQKAQTDYMQQLKEVAAAGLPLDEMEGRLAEAEEITPDDLRALAAARAQSVRDYLVNEGKISPERLFLTQSEPAAGDETAVNGKGPRVLLQLQ
jgi:Domain of Unknown Function (DUF748)